MAAARPHPVMTAPEARDMEGSRGSAETVMQKDGESRIPAAWKRWWVRLVKLVLTVSVTWLILRIAGIGLAEAREADWTLVRPRPAPIALSVALLALTFFIAAALWSRILVTFGERRVGLAEGASILVVANLGRYVPGKIAQLAGVAMLARRSGMSGVRATTAAVAAQVVNLLAAAALGGWVAMQSGDTTGARDLVVGLAIVAGLVGSLYFGGAGAVLRWALRRSGHAGDLPHPDGRRLLALLPGYILNWVVYGAAFVMLARGLGMELGFLAGTTAFAAAYFAGYVALFAPGGIGIREGTLAVFVAPALGADAGLVLAVLQRVWITAVELAGAAAGAFVLRRPVA